MAWSLGASHRRPFKQSEPTSVFALAHPSCVQLSLLHKVRIQISRGENEPVPLRPFKSHLMFFQSFRITKKPLNLPLWGRQPHTRINVILLSFAPSCSPYGGTGPDSLSRIEKNSQKKLGTNHPLIFTEDLSETLYRDGDQSLPKRTVYFGSQ